MKVFSMIKDNMKREFLTLNVSENMKRIDHLKINGMSLKVQNSQKNYIEIEWH